MSAADWTLFVAFLLAAGGVVLNRHSAKKPSPFVTAAWVLGIGGLAVFAGHLNNSQQRELERQIYNLGVLLDGAKAQVAQLQKKLTGDGSYAYVHLNNGQMQGGNFWLYLQGVGHVDNVTVQLYRIEDGMERAAISAGNYIILRTNIRNENVKWGPPIPAGVWKYYFKAPHHEWTQTLRLTVSGDRVYQSIEVQGPDGPIIPTEQTAFEIKEITDATK